MSNFFKAVLWCGILTLAGCQPKPLTQGPAIPAPGSADFMAARSDEPTPTPFPSPNEAKQTGCHSYFEVDQRNSSETDVPDITRLPLRLQFTDCEFKPEEIAIHRVFSYLGEELREVSTQPGVYSSGSFKKNPEFDVNPERTAQEKSAYVENMLRYPTSVCGMVNGRSRTKVRIFAQTELESGQKITSSLFSLDLTPEQIKKCEYSFANPPTVYDDNGMPIITTVREISPEEKLETNLIGKCLFETKPEALTLECAAVFDKHNILGLTPEQEVVYQRLRAQLPKNKQ